MTIVAVNGAGNIPHENVMDGTSNTIMVGEYRLGQPSERETFGQPITFTYTIQPGCALQGDDQSLNRVEQATDPINIVMGDGSVRFVSQTISPTETILPYIEQRGAEPGDGGDWISDPDTIYRDAGGDGVGLLDGGFVIDWTPAAVGGPGIDFFLDLGGTDSSSPDRFPTETVKMTYGAIEWSYTKDTGGGSEGDGGFVIDWTATDSSSRGSPIEVNHSEFSIVKLCDAATPKLLEADGVLDYSGGDGVGSNTLMFHDDLIGWNFTNNTNNPVADGDTGGHSFVFGVELPDAVELDNLVEVFVRSDPWPADTAPDADWLLL